MAEDAITWNCGYCDKTIRAPGSKARQLVKCPSCQKSVYVQESKIESDDGLNIEIDTRPKRSRSAVSVPTKREPLERIADAGDSIATSASVMMVVLLVSAAGSALYAGLMLILHFSR
jgi:endogenous inhibitor of DNA gyrase (YacG/DUF329 family)